MVSEMTVLDEIAAFSAGVTADDLPDEVTEQLTTSLLVNLAVARAGYRAVKHVVKEFVPRTVDGPASVLVSGDRTSVEHAAFANGFLMHARAQDDFQHSAHTHLGAVTVPCLLAIGQSIGVTGKDFLTGLAVAYQVSSALGSLAAWETSARGLRATPVYGPPGAAAGAARMCGGESGHIAAACGIAANSAVGFSQTWVDGTDEWRVQVAASAQVAARAFALSRVGLRASPNTFEGKYGVFPVLVGRDIDPNWMRDQLRTSWRTSSIGYKAYPVCGINLGPVRNAIELRRAESLVPDQIRAVSLRMTREDAAYPGIVERGPFIGPGAALMSTPYTVGLALTHGNINFSNIENPTDSIALGLAARTEITVDDELPEMSHIMEITDTAGRTYSRTYHRSSEKAQWDSDGIRAFLESLTEETGDEVICSDEFERAARTIGQAQDLKEFIEVVSK